MSFVGTFSYVQSTGTTTEANDKNTYYVLSTAIESMRAHEELTGKVKPIAWEGVLLRPINDIVMCAKLGFDGTDSIVHITKLGFDGEALPMSIARNTLLWYGDMVVAPLLFVLSLDDAFDGDGLNVQPSQVRCIAAPVRIEGVTPSTESPAFVVLDLHAANGVQYLPCSEASIQYAAASAKASFQAFWTENAVLSDSCVTLKDATAMVEALAHGVELMKRIPDTHEGKGHSHSCPLHRLSLGPLTFNNACAAVLQAMMQMSRT